MNGIYADSADPDVMPHTAVCHQGLHCLLYRKSICVKLLKMKNGLFQIIRMEGIRSA